MFNSKDVRIDPRKNSDADAAKKYLALVANLTLMCQLVR
jgi:hypothetical protein